MKPFLLPFFTAFLATVCFLEALCPLTDLNQVAAGTPLYMPERLTDGSITDHYANDVALNSNAAGGAGDWTNSKWRIAA